MRKKIEGFSLIESAISLFILGIISAITISQFRSIQKLGAMQKTRENINFVISSIAAYVISKDGELPFPSSDKENIGYQNSSLKNDYGIIPFKTLGIMERFAKNGNNRWILYKMNPYFCKENATNYSFKLDIQDFDSQLKNDKVAFIIKSVNKKEEEEIILWYAEKSFLSNFRINVTPQISDNKNQSEIVF